ncbi:hypothetical protein H5410_013339 [Solanum commersonii]|uniref:Uncharacterized protein n=1 Tax=Solanum commersonii TaxID=4109 RepID=A0A9J6AUU5_SOLCO|nr:hypothetical protein H5410_013339 [Solanum commersonii]
MESLVSPMIGKGNEVGRAVCIIITSIVTSPRKKGLAAYEALINSTLNGIPTYRLSLFPAPTKITKQNNFFV